MPVKSPTEMIRELQLDVNTLSSHVQRLDSHIQRIDLIKILERLAVIESQLLEATKREERAETRRWQIVLLFGGSLLTLLVQVVILFLKK